MKRIFPRDVFTHVLFGTYHLEWAKEKNVNKPLHQQSDEELNENLKVFYAEVRNQKGEDYGKSTLLCLRNGIERHLNFPPQNRGIKFSQNTTFRSSNMMLNAKIRDLKQQGKQKVQHKPAITEPDLQKLRVHPVLSPSTPLGLLRNVWFHTTLYWCRRGREGQRRLTPSSFTFLHDENKRPYATMTHDEASKNHPGGVDDAESFEKEGRMYKASDDPNDGFNALQLYISKQNPNCSAFYQYPKRKWSPDCLIWYENRPLGVNKLGDMMKDISAEAELSQKYTNHCVRATAITLWSNAGLANRHIMAISGHRNEQSLRSYNARPSSAQLQQSSDVLSRALATENSEFQLQLAQSDDEAPTSYSQISTTVQSNSLFKNSTFTNMFDGCSIGTVNVVLNPRQETQNK